MQLVGKLVQGFVRRRIADAAIDVADAVRGEAMDCAREVGLSIEKELKIRPGVLKWVFLVRHPVHGQCVFKYVSRHSPLNGYYAHVGAASLIRQRGHHLFPRVHEVGDRFTFEEYVAGQPISELPRAEVEHLDFGPFLRDIQRFGEDGAADGVLSRRECELIVYKHVNKLALSYLARAGPSTFARVARRRSHVKSLIRRTIDAAANCQVPRTLVVGDLAAHNVLRCETDGGALRVIDAEHVGTGFWGIDQVWFLLTLTRQNVTTDKLSHIFSKITSSNGIAVLGAAEFLRATAALLLTMNVLLAPKDSSRRSELLLRRVAD